MNKQDCKIGMIIKVTYPGGRSTLGKIIKLNPKTVLFEFLGWDARARQRYEDVELYVGEPEQIDQKADELVSSLRAKLIGIKNILEPELNQIEIEENQTVIDVRKINRIAAYINNNPALLNEREQMLFLTLYQNYRTEFILGGN